MGHRHHLNNLEEVENFLELCKSKRSNGETITVEFVQPENHRTATQNRCLHEWLTIIALRLNEAGLERTISSPVLKEPVEAPWTLDSVKELIWHPVQKAITGHESSRDCDKKDYAAIEQVISRHLASKFGLEVPAWPSRYTKGEQDG